MENKVKDGRKNGPMAKNNTVFFIAIAACVIAAGLFMGLAYEYDTNLRLRSENVVLRGQLVSINFAYNALNANHTALAKDHSALGILYDKKVGDYNELQGRCDQLQSKLGTLTSALAAAEKKGKDLQANLDSLTKEYGAYKAMSNATITEMNSTVAGLKTTILRLNNDISDLRSDNSDLRYQLNHPNPPPQTKSLKFSYPQNGGYYYGDFITPSGSQTGYAATSHVWEFLVTDQPYLQSNITLVDDGTWYSNGGVYIGGDPSVKVMQVKLEAVLVTDAINNELIQAKKNGQWAFPYKSGMTVLDSVTFTRELP